MSVPVRNRIQSKVEYISKAEELLRITIHNCIKMPKEYTFFGKTHAYELAQEVLDNCIKANKTNVNTDFEIRRQYLNNALVSLACLSNQVNILRTYVNLEEKKWYNWGIKMNETEALILGVLKSDKIRVTH